MTKAPTPAEMSKGQSDNTNNATRSSITQRLRTDLGRSVGVTTATQHKQPILRKSNGPDVSRWTWNQGHHRHRHREHHFCFMSRFADMIARDGQLHTSISTNEMISISTPQTFRSWEVIFHLLWHVAYLSLLSAHTIRRPCSSYECLIFPVSF